MPQVKRATNRGTLDSFGNAENKLIRQLGFPDVYDDRDTHIGEYHDRVSAWDSKHANRCLFEHTKGGDGGLGEWAANAKKTALIAFVRDFLKADPSCSRSTLTPRRSATRASTPRTSRTGSALVRASELPRANRPSGSDDDPLRSGQVRAP